MRMSSRGKVILFLNNMDLRAGGLVEEREIFKDSSGAGK
jgi:hypothetical protein